MNMTNGMIYAFCGLLLMIAIFVPKAPTEVNAKEMAINSAKRVCAEHHIMAGFNIKVFGGRDARKLKELGVSELSRKYSPESYIVRLRSPAGDWRRCIVSADGGSVLHANG